jgi:hypothetical protein
MTCYIVTCHAGDVFGDFEDVEEGLTFTGDDAITAAAQKAIKDATVSTCYKECLRHTLDASYIRFAFIFRR